MHSVSFLSVIRTCDDRIKAYTTACYAPPNVTAQTLQSFLESPARGAGTLKYHELEGFLFAVACAPDLVPPSDWIPIVFGDREPAYENVEQAKEMLTQMLAVYNMVNTAVAQHPCLPPDCPLDDDPLANLAEGAPVAFWSRGFLLGHDWLTDSWDPYVPREMDEEFGAMLMALTFFSSPRLADAYRKETKSASLGELATAIHGLFPEAVAEYAHLGRSIQAAIREAERSPLPPRRAAKTGRNATCPCGSGKKYKRCCEPLRPR